LPEWRTAEWVPYSGEEDMNWRRWRTDGRAGGRPGDRARGRGAVLSVAAGGDGDEDVLQ